MNGDASASQSSRSEVDLLAHALAGGADAVRQLFRRDRPRLRRMVEMRLDHRLHAGGAALDELVDEALAAAACRFSEYAADPKIPLFLWLRQHVGARLAAVHRERLGRGSDAAGDISLCRPAMPAASSVALAAHLLGRASTPILAEAQAERLVRLEAALNGLEPLDRDILSLRHFESLTHQEAAQALDLEGAAAARRYIRALKRLNEALADAAAG